MGKLYLSPEYRIKYLQAEVDALQKTTLILPCDSMVAAGEIVVERMQYGVVIKVNGVPMAEINLYGLSPAAQAEAGKSVGMVRIDLPDTDGGDPIVTAFRSVRCPNTVHVEVSGPIKSLITDPGMTTFRVVVD